MTTPEPRYYGSDDDILDTDTREVMELHGGYCDLDNWSNDYYYAFEIPEEEPCLTPSS